ncbi:alpha-(1,3)-fucosyltransferase C-like [Daphnia carinata]|uniref:alpha-(1,3)-fucosyltransferase C-like n=1 Tax=Daphnia carinata TaxID=120202 RepID=UPI0025802027|nr:alpha-(1,3)-fucosyltransferase C-like [Daphnia carinata]
MRPPMMGFRKSGETIQSSAVAFFTRLLRPRTIVSLFLVVCLGYLLVVSSNRHVIDNNQLGLTESNTFQSETEDGNSGSEPKRILYWTGYYDRPDMIFGFGQQPFIKAGCKVTNCVATADRNLLDQSDAIIFHAGQFNSSDLPSKRLGHQRYIFYLFETLPSARDSAIYFSNVVDNFFNWTMTHRRDSDIYCAEPYGKIRRKASSPWIEQLPPTLAPGERPIAPAKLMETVRNHPRLAKKDKLLAWFCSNQRTHGRREDYIRQLGQYMPVDIYGNCGNLTCLPKNSDRCNNLLDEYKFYLSAENSLCADYVSEKFYRALQTDIIPVVYGGADYAAYAPPHSYIHVADFASPKELAEYLLLLDKNEALYLKYFEWKKDYDVLRGPLDGWCDLCEKLNNPQEPIKSYESMAKWWYDDVPCYPGETFIQTVLNHDS